MGSYLSTEQPSGNFEAEEEHCHRMEGVRPQSLSEAQKFRNPPVTILNEILRVKVKLSEHLVKENNAILKEFLETFVQEMKKHDKTFDLLYNKIFYTGSYYSDLRVSTPDEFDLNLNLKLPFKQNCVSVEYQPQVPSYGKYRVNDPSSITQENGLVKLFENGYLIPEKVRTWIQSVVSKALNTYVKPRNVVNIRTSGSGPARTIQLIKRNGGVIDIDLVPAIQCSMNVKPPGIHGKVYEKVKNNLQCFLIPKPYQPTKQCPVSAAERARLWRTHYPEAENTLIHNLGCVKPVIKLLKLLRDKENWKILASYYLKTIVMWMVLENSTQDFWRNDYLFERFIDALTILADNVKNRKICYFFSSRYNLLEKLTEAQAFNISNRLQAIINDVKKDPRKLWTIFGCEPTFKY